jgi:hypothetical protein
LNSNAFHGFLVKFKGFWQAEMSSQQLYAQGMLKKEFPGSKFIHLTHYSTIMNCDWLTSKSPVLPLPPKIQRPRRKDRWSAT